MAAVAWPAGAEDTPAPATEPSPARSLDQLLERVRRDALETTRAHQDRERRFLAERDAQQRLLAEARAALAREEERSSALERRFNANETEFAALEERLRERMGTLGELFGIVRAVSADTQATLADSLTSAQLEPREEFLAGLARSRTLPSIAELKRLWLVLQEEATESGKVVRFPATVLTRRGGRVTKPVVRVGVFNAVADGEYLQFLGEGRELLELARQPPGAARAARALESAREGLVSFPIDPSRGQILSLLVEMPTFMERIDQGRTIGRIILVVALIGFSLAGQRWVALVLIGRRMSAQLEAGHASVENPLGRVLAVYERNRGEDVETLELKLDEAILKETPSLERFLTTVRVLSVVAPLLGLLGTVTGMIQTFQSIALFGSGDPKLMAGGISEALVTTMLGLYTAIPLVLMYNFVSGRSRALIHLLEEQSAGIVARHAEKHAATRSP